MPVVDGIGRSQETLIKHANLEKIFAMHLKITRRVIPKWEKWGYSGEYCYIDTHSGCGLYEVQTKDGRQFTSGSPVIFSRIAENMRLRYSATFIDIDADNLAELQSNIDRPNSGHHSFINGNCSEVVPNLIVRNKKKFGLLFVDPNGVPDFDMIAEVSRVSPKIEILIYCSGSAIKRTYDNHQTFLNEYINLMGKKFWAIREPRDKQQWTFLMGGNSDLFKEYKAIEFYDIESPQGQRILWGKLNYSKPQLEAMQKKSQPMLPIQNI